MKNRTSNKPWRKRTGRGTPPDQRTGILNIFLDIAAAGKPLPEFQFKETTEQGANTDNEKAYTIKFPAENQYPERDAA